MKSIVLFILGFAQIAGATEDYSALSAEKLDRALVVAVRNRCPAEVQRLVQAGANVDQKIISDETDYDMDYSIERTLLEYAAKHGYAGTVKALVQVKIKHENYFEQVIGFVRALLSDDMNADDDVNSALILAAEEGYVDVIRELLPAKPSIKAINKAFIHAAEKITTASSYNTSVCRYHLHVIKDLLKAGAHVNTQDRCGGTALTTVAARYCLTKQQKEDKVETIQVLLKANADVNYVMSNGDTALIAAIQSHDLESVKTLLQAPRINVNYANKDGDTALMIAVYNIRESYYDNYGYQNCVNSQKIVEILLKTPGINPYQANKKGVTAVMLLQKMK